MIVVYTLALGDGPPVVAQSLSPVAPGARNLARCSTPSPLEVTCVLSCLLDGIKCVFYTDAHTTLCNSRVPCGRNYHLPERNGHFRNEK